MKRILIITLALVFGLSAVGLAAGTFSGRWVTDFTITTPQTPVIGMTSVLTVNYAVAGWTFGSVSTLTRDGWTVQDFRADGALGAFTLTNLLRFAPMPVAPAVVPALTFLRSTAAVTLAGVDFETRFLVVPAGAGLRFRVGGRVDDHLTLVRATAYFGSLAFDSPVAWRLTNHADVPAIDNFPLTHELEFRGLDLDLTMRFHSFMLGIDADFASTGGFRDITFTVPAFPLGVPGFTLGLAVTYTLADKRVTLTPAIAVGEWVHFQPFITVAPIAADGLFGDLRLEGLRLTWVVDPRVTFIYDWDSRTAEPHIAGADNAQRIRISAAMVPITFTSAFAWARPAVGAHMTMFPQNINLDLSVAVLPGLSLRTGVDFRAPVLHAITFGFTVDW